MAAGQLDLVGPADLAWLDVDEREWRFLGIAPDDDSRWLALELPVPTTAGPAGLTEFRDGRTWANVRDIGATLQEPGAAIEAIALTQWHGRNPCCPSCGSATTPIASGWIRVCNRDGTEHHPRSDPAVIVTVRDDADRLLLGHAAHWPAGRFSLLAGFVEPGESFEAAVRREVFEETAIVVDEVRYLASQPWPFPASVMVGMTARARSVDITFDGLEGTEAFWVTRPELAARVDGGTIRLPMPSSIARALIEDWYRTPRAIR